MWYCPCRTGEGCEAQVVNGEMRWLVPLPQLGLGMSERSRCLLSPAFSLTFQPQTWLEAASAAVVVRLVGRAVCGGILASGARAEPVVADVADAATSRSRG